jgi:cytochrome P450
MALFSALCQVLIPATICYFVYTWYKTSRQRNQLAKKHGCLPPSNYATGGDPILGLSFILETIRRAKKSEYMQVTLERFRRFGTTYVNKRLLYETISTIDGDNVKAILTTNFEDFEMPAIRVKALSPLFGNGIFVSDGAQWSHARGLLRPIFTRQNMSPLLDRLETHFQLLLQNIPSDGQTVDLGQLFFYLTLDVATEFLVGQSTNILDSSQASKDERQFADDYLFCCTEAVGIIRLGPLHRLARSSKEAITARDRAWQYVDRYVDEAFRLRETSKEASKEANEYNFLAELASQTEDRQVVREQILNILLASRDTTAALLGNLFFMLARHADVYQKLRDEVRAVAGNDTPTEDQLKSMQWLRWCINECEQ